MSSANIRGGFKMLGYAELFDYFKAERRKLFHAFREMPFDEFVRNRELSFYSIKDTFLHTLSVEDNWLHYRAAGLETESPVRFEDFKSIEAIEKYSLEVDAKTRALFATLDSQAIQRPVIRKYPDGHSTTQSLGWVLYHIPIEVIHHYGEIFAEFWKGGKDAPYLSYLAFKREATQTK